jgi:hypothetical protein
VCNAETKRIADGSCCLVTFEYLTDIVYMHKLLATQLAYLTPRSVSTLLIWAPPFFLRLRIAAYWNLQAHITTLTIHKPRLRISCKYELQWLSPGLS